MSRLAVIVPVYNEELILKENINELLKFLNQNVKQEFNIIILDSFSNDKTQLISKNMASSNKKIQYFNIKSPGKGGKIKKFVLSSDYDYYGFIDADLPISMENFYKIISEVLNDRADLAIASRYIHGFSSVKSRRRPSRKFASKIYNFILKIFFDIPTHDAFAGAKSWNRKIKENIWPKIRDEKWFFDTELICYTAKYKYRIKEVPVIYNDSRRDSKLNLFTDGTRIAVSLFKLIINK